VLFAGPEFLDRIAQYAALGTTVERSYMSPLDYSQEVQSGIRDKLNGVDETGIARKVLDEDIPILGGMGMGDLYQIGFGVAESFLSANTVGRAFASGGKLAVRAALMANGFARTTTATIDSAHRMGADGKQSMALGLTIGLLEAAVGSLPMDDLLRITPATTVKELLPTILKHSALEGLTEAVTEGLGQVAEYRILGDLSTYSQRRQSYLRQGFPPEEAERKALRDSMNDLGFTMLAATASGALSAGTQSALESSLAALHSAEADIKANAYSVADVFQTRRELSQLSGAYERFSPEGQKRLSQLEARLQDLQTKYENNVKATQDRDAHLEAIRRELDSPDHQPPFSPALYRLALETATPHGWKNTDIPAMHDSTDTDYLNHQPAILESPGETGEKAIPYSERGIEIEPRIKEYMEKLTLEGVYISDKAGSYNMEDLQILTAETGMEYTLLTIDDKSYLIRGGERGTPIPDELAETLYNKQGDFVCHTHPYIGDLNPSKSDLEFMKSLTWQQESIIIDPSGEMVVFDKNGVKEKKNVSSMRNQSYYDELF